MIVLEKYNGITVLRDDLLTGGTKSILMPSIISDAEEYVYASPVYGVQVGAEYKKEHERLTVLKYHKGFDKSSKHIAPFNSVPNYDLKALEYCEKYKVSDDVLFWNVL